jgi:hypothetical protein
MESLERQCGEEAAIPAPALGAPTSPLVTPAPAARAARLATVPRCHFAALLALILLSGCAREEKVVQYKPFFSGLSGAQMQTQPVAERPRTGSGEVIAESEMFRTVVENPDGSRTLLSKSGRQLMSHIQNTLADNDAELFVAQVLSEATLREYAERQVDPREAFIQLKKSERDIAMLFSRMPLGENSPNVIMETIGRNMFRIRLSGASARDVGRYRGFDMVLENGNWRLRWFH